MSRKDCANCGRSEFVWRHATECTKCRRTEREAEMEARIAELENLLAEGVHSCSHLCKRPMCVLRRELKAEREANARLEKWQDIVRRYSRYAAMYADARMPADYWEGKQE